MRLQPESFLMAALLTALVAIAPLSTDMYLPALPTIAQVFNAPTAEVQLTLSVYLIGFAGAQLLFGPLSDRFGRRPVLIAGLVVFCLASLACWFASDIYQLIIARFFQAVGACAGGAVGRAVVRDVHGTKGAARVLGHMGTAMAAAPLIAPLIGGQLTAHYGWHANFAALAGIGIFLLALTVIMLPESHTHLDRLAMSPRRMASNYAMLIKHANFRGFMLAGAFSFAGLFAFISGSSFVLIEDFGMTPESFGFAFGAVVLGFMTGTQVSVRLLKKFSMERLIGIGGRLSLIAGVAGILSVSFGPHSIVTVIAPMFCYTFSVGFIMPNSMAGAIGPFSHMAGAASALMGFMQMAVASLMGAMVGYLHDGTPLPMMGVIAVTGTLTWLFATGVEKRHREAELSSQK